MSIIFFFNNHQQIAVQSPAVTVCLYLLSRNKDVLILGGVVVVLLVFDLDVTLYLKLKQM